MRQSRLGALVGKGFWGREEPQWPGAECQNSRDMRRTFLISRWTRAGGEQQRRGVLFWGGRKREQTLFLGDFRINSGQSMEKKRRVAVNVAPVFPGRSFCREVCLHFPALPTEGPWEP